MGGAAHDSAIAVDFYEKNSVEVTADDTGNIVKNILEQGFSDRENQPGARVKILNNMLVAWKNGEVEKVDPAKYEHFISSAFKSGKMNEEGDARIFFLLKGVATGLLSQDFLMRLGSDGKSAALRDFFAEKKSSKSNIVDFVDKYFPKNTEWSPVAATGVEKFWQDEVMQSEQARDRIQRQDISKMDHDDFSLLATEFSVDQVRKIFETSAISDDAAQKILEGWNTFVEKKGALSDTQKESLREFVAQMRVRKIADTELQNLDNFLDTQA